MLGGNKTYNELAGRKVQRIEAISDGVFAIALTLLVLDIKVPGTEGIHSERDLLSAVYNLMPKFLSYFLSFMTLGIFWTGQSVQHSFIEKSDRDLNWISLFFLLFVSLLPFTTGFLSEHIDFKISIGLYWLNIFLLGLLIYVHWAYAYKHGFVALASPQKEVVNRAIRRRIIVAQSLYALGALLCFINNYLSIVFIIAVQLNYALAPFFQRKSGNATPEHAA